MKIFAKRGSKAKGTTTTTTTTTTSPAENAKSGSDDLVLELLKKNPECWNAKERRLVKRYYVRNPDEEPTKSIDNIHEVTTQVDRDISIVEKEKLQQQQQQQERLNNATTENDVNATSPELDESFVHDHESAHSKVHEQQSPESPVGDCKTSHCTTEIMEEEDVTQLLDKLNSKNKRKLSRHLEREGMAGLKFVREEALKLIEQMKEKVVPVVKEKIKETTPDLEPVTATASDINGKSRSSSKKRKRDDLSVLSPEERLRRDEQRRKQKEAAERRASNNNNGDQMLNGKHKHPLNSERRRANRRKPKWIKKAKVGELANEHDTSGFQMRKLAKHS